ncbi:MAG: galactokinase [Deltaproteobacteria bacterium]|nr:galactokinase [Deltaproteobacteria bacterium]
MLITRSPLRISLGGGGTDLASYYRLRGGHFVSAAIDKYVYVALGRTFGQEMLIRYSSTERARDPTQIQHPIVREVLVHMGVNDPRLELTTMADVPAGMGLGSSGSFTSALLLALFVRRGEQPTKEQLAELASLIEISRLGRSVGKQDPYVAVFGGVRAYSVRSDGYVDVTELAWDASDRAEFRGRVLLFSTSMTHDASSILSEQDGRTLGRDAEMIANLDEVKEIGLSSRAALERRDFDEFGRLLDRHWRLKRLRSGTMSSALVDRAYGAALDSGALGGKLIGAGGGGFLMFYTTRPDALRNTMSELGLEELRWDFDLEGTKVLA